MEPGSLKWSPVGPNGAWEIQMELGSSKWSMGGSNRASADHSDVTGLSLALLTPHTRRAINCKLEDQMQKETLANPYKPSAITCALAASNS